MSTSVFIPSSTKHPKLQAVLDNVQERFTHGGVTGAMDMLIDGLHEIFHSADPDHWPEIEVEAASRNLAVTPGTQSLWIFSTRFPTGCFGAPGNWAACRQLLIATRQT